MRILFVIPALTGGGAERQLELLAKGLATMNHSVRVLHFQSEAPKRFAGDLTYRKLILASNYSPKLLTILYDEIRHWQPDIVQTWISQVDVAIGLLRVGRKFNWVIRESSDKGQRKPSLKLRLRRLLGRRASCIVANSRNGLRYWRGQLPEDRLLYIPNGFEFSTTKATPNATPPLQLLSVGRMIDSKRHDLTLDLFHHVLQFSEARLTIAGDGPLRKALGQRADELGIAGRVNFPGFLDRHQLNAAFVAADWFVSFSAQEGMPNVVVEAAGFNLPMILSDIPGHREVIPTDAAIYVQTGDTRSIKKVAARLRTGDTQQWTTMGRRAGGSVRHLSVAAMARAYSTLYQQIIG